MKAIACTRYGPPDVLQLMEVEKPIPRDNEVLIAVRAAAVTVSDCIVRSGKVSALLWLPMRAFVGFRGPRRPILGLELAGEVETSGKDVRRLKKGDQVFAFAGKHFGAFAEYICLPEDGSSMPADSLVAPKPPNATYEEAATAPSRGTLALHFLRRGGVQHGQKVLVFGASGGVGTFAVQIAKHLGAEVTAVCSTANLEFVRSLGADHVIDYTKEDFTTGAKSYDVIFDAVGKRYSSKLQCRRALAPKGQYLSVDDGTPKIRLDDLLALKELMEKGHVRSMVDRRYPLEELAEAHRYVEQGHKRGGVAITVGRGLGRPKTE